MPAMQAGALCIPFGEKSLHKKTEREKQGLGPQAVTSGALDTVWAQSGGFCQHCPWEVEPTNNLPPDY